MGPKQLAARIERLRDKDPKLVGQSFYLNEPRVFDWYERHVSGVRELQSTDQRGGELGGGMPFFSGKASRTSGVTGTFTIRAGLAARLLVDVMTEKGLLVDPLQDDYSLPGALLSHRSHVDDSALSPARRRTGLLDDRLLRDPETFPKPEWRAAIVEHLHRREAALRLSSDSPVEWVAWWAWPDLGERHERLYISIGSAKHLVPNDVEVVRFFETNGFLGAFAEEHRGVVFLVPLWIWFE